MNEGYGWQRWFGVVSYIAAVGLVVHVQGVRFDGLVGVAGVVRCRRDGVAGGHGGRRARDRGDASVQLVLHLFAQRVNVKVVDARVIRETALLLSVARNALVMVANIVTVQKMR